jgi:hypothetical protein
VFGLLVFTGDLVVVGKTIVIGTRLLACLTTDAKGCIVEYRLAHKRSLNRSSSPAHGFGDKSRTVFEFSYVAKTYSGRTTYSRERSGALAVVIRASGVNDD